MSQTIQDTTNREDEQEFVPEEVVYKIFHDIPKML